MGIGWIVLACVGWGIAMLFLLLLLRMSCDQDRAARHAEKRLFPHSDVTITRWTLDDSGEFVPQLRLPPSRPEEAFIAPRPD